MTMTRMARLTTITIRSTIFLSLDAETKETDTDTETEATASASALTTRPANQE
jgi:hypothetical protein